jgi:hypothetical protein
MRAAVLRVLRPAGVKRVVIAGLAGDYINYISTPKEYGRQSYEGGSSLWGPNEATFLNERFTELAQALRAGRPAAKPYDLDVSYGVKPDGAAYPDGAASGAITQQPSAVERLQRATLTFMGAPSAHDMPVDRAFVAAQRRVRGRWRTYTTDLGLQFLWRVAEDGVYRVQWEVPLTAPRGTYRFRVSARRYALTSAPFTVSPSTALKVQAVPGGVRLAYPEAVVNVDLTARPAAANGGVVQTSAGTVRKRRGTVFAVPSGATVVSARDRYGNTGQPQR